ncbi:MAG TPA: hypothetical protein VFX44_08245 [Solirubrobacterales bacterium]|nr:hypothetical protein [Solirubrobacterales bacterium]
MNLRGKGGSKCSEWLGSGKDRVRLPGLYLGAQGRGQLEWDIPSDTSTGDNQLKATCGYSGVRSTSRTIVDIPESAVSSTFTTVLNVLLYVVLAASLVYFFWQLLKVVGAPPESERFPRATAMIGGGMVALLAEVSGTGFADQIVESLAGSSPAGAGVKLLAAVVPGGAAVAFGWYFSYAQERSTYKAIRWVVLLGMLTLVSFAVLLAEATNAKGVFLGEAAIPNASFVLGLIFSVIAFGKAEDESGEGGLFRGVFGRFRPKSRNPFAED